MLHWLHSATVCLVSNFPLALMVFYFFLFSYLSATGILEQITKKCLMVREPIENQQSLLLPLLAMVGFLTKISEISTRDNFMSIVKSTEIFGTVSLMYKTMSLGELIHSVSHRTPHGWSSLLLFARNSKREKVLIECNNKPLKMIWLRCPLPLPLLDRLAIWVNKTRNSRDDARRAIMCERTENDK